MKHLRHYFLLIFTLILAQPVVALHNDAALMKELLLQADHLDKAVLSKALMAFSNAQDEGITASPVFTIIDYSKPSNKPRLWIFDLEYSELLYEELVSHGQGSGDLYARQFSNEPGSWQSSLGLFITENTYYGRNGYSLRLEGLEQNINHLAKERAIVFHGADYADPNFVQRYGRLGRSHGCPVVSKAVNRELIDTIKDGSLVFIYYPERTFLAESEFLQEPEKQIRLSLLNPVTATD